MPACLLSNSDKVRQCPITLSWLIAQVRLPPPIAIWVIDVWIIICQLEAHEWLDVDNISIFNLDELFYDSVYLLLYL